MSFRTSSGESESAFERVRQSLLQREGLPFAKVLTAARLAEVFDEEGVDFGNVDDDPEVIDTPAVTLWAFLSQMLFTGESAYGGFVSSGGGSGRGGGGVGGTRRQRHQHRRVLPRAESYSRERAATTGNGDGSRVRDADS